MVSKFNAAGGQNGSGIDYLANCVKRSLEFTNGGTKSGSGKPAGEIRKG